ncbi:Ig-like domain repeat protein [Dietzia sp. NCCP-2495]|uniref:beta strand repeat-containing protein n=1 Tax=Dietzia sp. NCCP-2495 TaxID=2934675 RepID=UPI00222EDF3A|nr:Ig-like domain repeat protein [Dietzia sp. NCCP-2495]
MGPTITVQRKGVTTTLAEPGSVVIGQPTTLNATTDAPDGTIVSFLVGEDVVATATAQGGVANATWTAAAPGSYAITARTGQSPTHSESASATVTAQVTQSISSVNLEVGTPRHVGTTIPLTATTTGIPDGQSIDFRVGGTSIGTADVVGGTAIFTGWTPTEERDYSVEAHYAGSTNIASSASVPQTITVSQPVQETTTTLAVDPDPAPGTESTLTATVTDGHDGDDVEFFNHGQPLGTAQLQDGKASFTWKPTNQQAAQSYSLTATYRGSTGYADSTSNAVTGTVGLIQTTVSDVDVVASAEVGQRVDLQATVTGGTPGEFVEFRNGDTVLARTTLSANGNALVGWTPTATGEYHVTAHYEGTSTTTQSQSPQATTVTVGRKASSIELTGPTSSSVGSSETLTAQTIGIADGQTITFEIQGEQSRPAQVAAGKASIDWTPTATGSHTIRAVYAGSETVAGAESDELVVVVDARQTTTSTVTASADPKTGAPVTLTATVTGGVEGVDVQFRNGDQVLCTGQVGADGTASCAWTPEEIGDVAVTAHYAGTDTTSASDSATPTTVSVGQGVVAAPSGLTISPAAPTAADTLTVSGTAPAGSEVTVFLFTNNSECTATADASGAFQCELGTLPAGQHELNAYALLNNVQSGTATLPVSVSTISTSIELTGPGSVQPGETADLSLTTTGIADGESVDILVNGKKKGTATVTGGEATYQWLAEATGTFTITASYAGNTSTEAADSAPLTITVDETATQTSGVAAPGSVTIGQTVPLQATVTRGTPGVDVQFRNGTDVLCTGQVGADGTVSCNWIPAAAGAVAVRAHYMGDATTSASQSAKVTSVTVGKTASTVALEATDSVVVGGAITFTVTTTGIANGQTVDIVVGGNVVASPTVTGDTATATWTAPATAGTLTATAKYGGNDAVAGSESTPVSIDVGVAQTQTSAVTASADATAGEPVRLSATVTGGVTGVDVQFRGGTDALCTGQVAANGTVECDWIPAAAGDVSVTAHYVGDGTTGASQSTTATAVTVAEAPDTEAPATPAGVTVSPQPVKVGEQVTVSGTAEAGSTVTVTVGGDEVCSVTATGGTFTCSFDATEDMDGKPVAVTATDGAGNTSEAADGGSLQLEAEVVDPVAPTVTLTPAQPVAGQPVALALTGEPGVEVVVSAGADEVCRVTLDQDGTGSCEWTPAAEGQVTLTVTAGDQTVTKIVTVTEAPDTEAPAAPTGVTVSPQPVTVGEQVTVSGSAEAGSTVTVTVGGDEVCSVTATGGTFTCSFDATEAMDGKTVEVTATDAADNTSGAADGGSLQVEAPVVDPTEPTITVTPAQPVAGEKVEITVTGDAGEQVVITDGDTEICRVTLGDEGTATCEWTPAAAGQVTLTVSAGDMTVEKTVTVREDDDDDDDTGSLDMGSLGGLFGGAGGSGSSGSLGSLSSLGS